MNCGKRKLPIRLHRTYFAGLAAGVSGSNNPVGKFVLFVEDGKSFGYTTLSNKSGGADGINSGFTDVPAMSNGMVDGISVGFYKQFFGRFHKLKS